MKAVSPILRGGWCLLFSLFFVSFLLLLSRAFPRGQPRSSIAPCSAQDSSGVDGGLGKLLLSADGPRVGWGAPSESRQLSVFPGCYFPLDSPASLWASVPGGDVGRAGCVHSGICAVRAGLLSARMPGRVTPLPRAPCGALANLRSPA